MNKSTTAVIILTILVNGAIAFYNTFTLRVLVGVYYSLEYTQEVVKLNSNVDPQPKFMPVSNTLQDNPVGHKDHIPEFELTGLSRNNYVASGVGTANV